MPNAFESQIKDRILSFTQELDLLVRKSALEALSGALNRSAAAARLGRPAGTSRGPSRFKSSGRGGNVDEAVAKIIAHVQSNEGQGIGTIADATGVALKVAKKAAVKLLAEGALKKSGQKRGTVYHLGSGKPARTANAKRGKRRGKNAKAA